MAKSSFQISKSVDFETLLLLIKRFTAILKQKENFALNKVVLVSKRDLRNEDLLKNLVNTMQKKLYNDCKNNITSDVDFCNKELDKYRDACNFYIPLEKGERIDDFSVSCFGDVIQDLKDKGD